MIRIIACVALICTGLALPWWCFVIATFFFALLYSPYEPLLIAVLIDAHFGTLESLFPYLYTVYTIVVVIFARLIRPRFSL